MNDQSTDLTVRTAFAELRYAEQPRFAPPGIDAARRTIRHRQQARAAVAAHLAVAAVLAGGYLAAAQAGPADREGGIPPGVTALPSPPASTPPELLPSTEPPDPGSVCDQGGSNDAEERALDALDDGPAPIGSRYNTFFVDEGAGLCGHTLFDTHDPRLETESYQVQVWCGDEFGGSATVTLRAADTEATAVAECAMTGQEIRAGVGETVLNASSDHEIEVYVEVDESAWDDGARPVLAIEAIPQGADLPQRPGA